MTIKLSKKFTDKDLDIIINSIYDNFKKSKGDKYIFDLTDTEYIANQELLILSSLFSLFIANNIEFEVVLFQKGIPTNEIPKRVRKQIIELWTVWGLWRIIKTKEYKKYFGLDGTSIELLQKQDNYYPSKAELYGRYGVTPYVPLDFINNYDAIEIQQRINGVFKLSEAIEEVLESNKCFHPFTSNSLSTIISEELYLNFLDHSLQSSFPNLFPFAALSISFKKKYRDEIKYQNKYNFESERITETKPFFYNSNTKEFHNRGYIEFSFLDFGSGIPNTLRTKSPNSTDNDILKFAFQHDSSRHPITIVADKPENQIPRGLFDALTIVRRYKGLLIVRSNYGKIFYDFSKTEDIEKAFNTFGNSQLFFPGTLISLYIPAIENKNKVNEASIKPEVSFEHVKPKNKVYVNLNEVLKDVTTSKENLYSHSLQALREAILVNKEEATLIYLSFLGCQIEDRIARKILIYLMTDYDINIKTNVVIIHGPSDEVINSVSEIINSLSSVYQKYKIHPLPILDYQNHKDEIKIKWLGIYDKVDILKLNELLFIDFSIAKTDFNEPSNIEGHILTFDIHGNLQSNFPNESELLVIFKKDADKVIRENFLNILKSKGGIVKDNEADLYLCNGNYYQKEYIEINNIINSKEELEALTNIFFKKLKTNIDNINNFHFIGVTSTSNKLLQSLIDLNLISKEQHWSFDNFESFDTKVNSLSTKSEKEYILICDVISTGFLTKKIANKLVECGSQLNYIGVLVSVIDESFRNKDYDLNDISKRTISILDYKIDKYEVESIKDEILNKNIIRINPYTNIPIRLSYKETNYRDSIIFHSKINYIKNTNEIVFENDFLDTVSEENLKIGYYKFNNVIHPYFFDTTPILENLKVDLLKKIFDKINKPNLKSDKVQVFYPRDSGIKSDIFFSNVKTGLGNDNLEVIEIDRINTNEGWRFPHNSKHLSSKVDANLCLIIDDGSSTGDSLIQMIDEISFYNAKEIILLCFIGRINDHKREFFSRLSSINVKKNTSVDLSIYFATHWHIPTYYLDNNPISKEKNWLKELIGISNIPNNIKRITKRVLEEIEPKDENFKDYQFLPKIKGTNQVPKKELIKRREEIGKVIGYRLYKESFRYFDFFIQKYSQKKHDKEVNRYKEIELICACFVYEPYLYDKLTKVLPDVVSLIKQFVRSLIYSYENYQKHRAYDWDKKDIIHLFFIVFKNEMLLKELTKVHFNQLIKFTEPSEFCLDYLLFKLLKYFPISETYESNRTSRSMILNHLIYQSQRENIKQELHSKLEVFNHFIATISPNSTFEEILNKIITEYSKIDPKSLDHHNDNLKADKQVLKELLTDIDGKLYKNIDYSEDKQSVITYSKRLVTFLENILVLSNEYATFFIEGKMVEDLNSNQENSLRMLHKEYNDIIYSNNVTYNVKRVKNILDKIYANFINEKSNLFKLFQQVHTDDIIQLLKDNINDKYSITGNLNNYKKDYSVNIPKFFVLLIFKELDSNFRHSFGEIKITVAEIGSNFSIEILTNKLKGKKGRNNGSKLFTNLNNAPFGIEYIKSSDSKQFIQIFKCKQL